MAKGNTTTKAENTAASTDRTEPMDVTGQDALGLAAAYSGLYHLFDARVGAWDVTTEGLVAKDFTVDSKYDADLIIKDINRKDRRAPLFPAILSIVNPDVAPPLFDNNLDITTFMVNFWKGSMGPNSSKTPEYVRTAAADYKERVGAKVRKGPKVRTINLKNVREISADTLRGAGLTKEDIQYLVDQFQAITPSDAQETPAAEVATA